MRAVSLSLLLVLTLPGAVAGGSCVPKDESLEIAQIREDALEAIHAVKSQLASEGSRMKSYTSSSMYVIDLGVHWEVTVVNPRKRETGGNLVYHVEKQTRRILCRYISM